VKEYADTKQTRQPQQQLQENQAGLEELTKQVRRQNIHHSTLSPPLCCSFFIISGVALAACWACTFWLPWGSTTDGDSLAAIGPADVAAC
jgi:hypothetical protein